MKTWKYYKHPHELLEEDVSVGWAYGILKQFASIDGIVVTNPLSLLLLLGGKTGNKANKDDLDYIRYSLQRLLDMKLIRLQEFSKGVLVDTTKTFTCNDLANRVKATDNIVVLIEDIEPEYFTSVYLDDVRKMFGLTLKKQSKLFGVYVAIMSESYSKKVFKTTFDEIKVKSNISTNTTVSKYVALLTERQILSKVNAFKTNIEGVYNYARYEDRHLLGSDEYIKVNEEARELRNLKRSANSPAKRTIEDLFGQDDVIEEPKVEEELIDVFPYDFESWQGSCPLTSYIACDDESVDFYIDSVKYASYGYDKSINIFKNKKIIDNKNSFIHKLVKESGKINIAVKENGDDFLRLLYKNKILKSVV